MVQIFGVLGPLLLLVASVRALNFDYEKVQLGEVDVKAFPAISFGDASLVAAGHGHGGPRCKVQPEDATWPSDDQWARFNVSVGGHLLKPRPVGAACYPGPEYSSQRCDFLLTNATATRLFLDDPITALTTWGEGATCLQLRNTTGRTCTQGGFPVYVVNATSVSDIQAAVNFARNQNLRLVIKNTGHDFIAKSSGRGALSVWTHFLKGIQFLDSFEASGHRGPAARISAGIEAWEAYNAMAVANNVTVVVPLDPTVGYGGGWTLGGGHGALTSLRGLGADQVLSLQVVTADGKFVTADGSQNQDLFFALRGGGGGTFGIVTSTVVKAWAGRTDIGGVTFFFKTGPGAVAVPGTRGYPASEPVDVADIDVFWKGYGLYLRFAERIVDVGGFGFGDVTPQGNGTFLFASTITVPGMTADQVKVFAAPLFAALKAAGIDISSPDTAVVPYAQPGTGVTAVSFPGSPSDRLFISRLLPRALWANTTRLDLVAAANRASAEQGYRVTTRAYAPTADAAGHPGNETAAVNPAMRIMVAHCVTFKQEPVDTLAPSAFAAEHARLRARVNELRRLTPESGTYFNEADRLEPGWQDAFWGVHYPRLVQIKKTRDPWALFWAPTAVGSEEWNVVTANGLPTQDGPLCRTAK